MEQYTSKLKRWAMRRHESGWSVTDICNHGRIASRMTFYRWLNAYKRDGSKALEPCSRAPHTRRYKVTPEAAAEVIALREQRGMCPARIELHLKQQGTNIGHTTIHNIIRSAGLNHPLQAPRKKRTYTCWGRRHPNSLWQTDFSFTNGKYLLAFLDDCSRFVTGAELFDGMLTDGVLWLLEEAISEYGKPREVLSDHGSQFHAMRGGTSRFDDYCRQRGIRHILAGVRRPTTSGKIERWFHTYKTEAPRFTEHAAFIKDYNYERPHMALGGATPASVYFNK